MRPSLLGLRHIRLLARQWRSTSAAVSSRSTSADGDNSQGEDSSSPLSDRLGIALAVAVATSGVVLVGKRVLHARSTEHRTDNTPEKSPVDENAAATAAAPVRSDLPVFSLDEVRRHGRNADKIWVTHRNGVYDVTEFVGMHPGGNKLLLAAGGPVEPFWSLYAQHNTEEVLEILEGLRCGTLSPEDARKLRESEQQQQSATGGGAFRHEPRRHPALKVNAAQPFNAETPLELLTDEFYTNNSLFFVRNHLPVPLQTDEQTHRVKVEGGKSGKAVELSVDELKRRFKPVSIVSAVQCSGNRRADMNAEKKVMGLMWEGGAIGCAKWTGARLKDILEWAGVDPTDSRHKHVQFEGADVDPEGKPYGASILFQKAIQDEVIVAWAMNDQPIPRDHGFPLRLIVPGVVGARQVKWLTLIRVSSDESPNHFQQNDYKQFPPSVQVGDSLDFSGLPAIQEYPLQSAICMPAKGAKVQRGSETIEMTGYAWSGGGRGIVRVEVSADGGQTWQTAELQREPTQDLDTAWAWTLWRASVPIPKGANRVQLMAKATDRAHNCQPETAKGIWNVRGLLHNAWHRVDVEVVDE